MGPPPLIASYVSTFSVLLGFGLLAAYYSTFKLKKTISSPPIETVEHFITARGTQGFWSIFWSFYASAVGAWVCFLPPTYTSFG